VIVCIALSCCAIVSLTCRAASLPMDAVIPIVGVGFSIWLIIALRDWLTYARFAGWFVIGLIIYLAYSRRHSRLALVQQASSDGTSER